MAGCEGYRYAPSLAYHTGCSRSCDCTVLRRTFRLVLAQKFRGLATLPRTIEKDALKDGPLNNCLLLLSFYPNMVDLLIFLY